MWRTLVGTSLVVASAGCAAGIHSDFDVLYVGDPVREPVRPSEIAILPVTPGPGLEPHRRLFLDSLARAIQREHGIVVGDADYVGRRVDEAGLVGEYAELLTAHERSGITDSEVVRRLSEAVGIRYLLIARLSYSRVQVVEYNPLLKSPTSEALQELQVVAQIWDGRDGSVAWELAGLVSSQPSTFTVSRSPEDMVLVAIREVARQLPIARVAVEPTGLDISVSRRAGR